MLKLRVPLLLVGTFLLGCGGGGDSGTPPVTNTRSGAWDGTTDQNLPVHIRVNAAGAIDTLSVRLSATLGGPICTATIVRTGLSVGADGSFQTTVGIGFDTPMRGRFTSATAVSGTIDARSGSFAAECGTLVSVGTGSTLPVVQWQAQKQ